MAKKDFVTTPAVTEANPSAVNYKSKAAKEQALRDLGVEEIIKEKIKESNQDISMEIQKLKMENLELLKKIANKPESTRTVVQEKMVYPKTERKSTVITDLEKQFKAYGVGTKTLRFIRRGYSGDLMLKPSATITRNGEVVRIAYAYNHESPFVEDHPHDAGWHPETKPVRFSSIGNESSISVPPTDPCLQRYLISNPAFGTEYYIEDKKRKAQEELEREDKVFRAIQAVNKIFEDKSEVLPRILSSYLLSASIAVSSTIPELKYECRSLVKENPDLLVSFDRNREYAEMLYLFFASQAKGLLEVRDNYIVLSWNNKKLTAVTTTPEESFAHAAVNYPNYVSILREKTGV